mgnify:CR=1 FL=1|tara:strand:- start:629 stop:1264 length:636 start_codon:yes stop_codon:yes gene_type:complete
MEENKIDVPVLKTPKEVSDLLISITKVNIFEKTRVRNVIEHRAFLCYLLKDKFDMGPSAISSFMRTQPKLKTYDHATAIHALKMFKVYKPYRKEYFDTLETYFKISPDENYEKLPSLENMVNKYVLYKNRYYNARNKIKRQEEKLKKLKENLKDLKEFKKKATAVLTENEILYRDLDKKQMQVYDERAGLILKSFEWQKPKNEYEIINCAS